MNNKKNILIFFAVFAAILMLVPPTMGRITTETTTSVNVEKTTIEENTCSLCSNELPVELTEILVEIEEELIILEQNGLVPEELSAQVAQVLAFNPSSNAGFCFTLCGLIVAAWNMHAICDAAGYETAADSWLELFEDLNDMWVEAGCGEDSISVQANMPAGTPTTR